MSLFGQQPTFVNGGFRVTWMRSKGALDASSSAQIARQWENLTKTTLCATILRTSAMTIQTHPTRLVEGVPDGEPIEFQPRSDCHRDGRHRRCGRGIGR